MLRSLDSYSHSRIFRDVERPIWINIASQDAMKFLPNFRRDFLDYYGRWNWNWNWPAVVLMPKECKQCVGGMSVTELRQQLEDYWGQGDILDVAIEEDSLDMAKINLNLGHSFKIDRAVFSHSVNKECTQWLSYLIAKNHTLGAVHAWFTAFVGVIKDSLFDLAISFNKVSYQDLKHEAFMESIHRIKFRMSFDVCIEGHDEVVDGLPSLPSNAMITTNEQGMQIIHNSIDNMFPRRIWDICANTVIPATWFCGPPCPLTGRQGVGTLGVKPRTYIVTETNPHMWPIPLPKRLLLEDVRGEMIRLGTLCMVGCVMPQAACPANT